MIDFYNDEHLPWWVRKMRRMIKYNFKNYRLASEAMNESQQRIERWCTGSRSPHINELEEALNRIGYRITIERIK